MNRPAASFPNDRRTERYPGLSCSTTCHAPKQASCQLLEPPCLSSSVPKVEYQRSEVVQTIGSEPHPGVCDRRKVEARSRSFRLSSISSAASARFIRRKLVSWILQGCAAPQRPVQVTGLLRFLRSTCCTLAPSSGSPDHPLQQRAASLRLQRTSGSLQPLQPAIIAGSFGIMNDPSANQQVPFGRRRSVREPALRLRYRPRKIQYSEKGFRHCPGRERYLRPRNRQHCSASSHISASWRCQMHSYTGD